MVKDKLASGVLVTAFLFSFLWAGSLYAPVTAIVSAGNTNLASGSLDTNYMVVRALDSPTAGTSCRTAGQTCGTASECCDTDSDPCTTPTCSTVVNGMTVCALQTQAGCTQQCKALGTQCKPNNDTCCPSDNDSCRNDVCGTVPGRQGNFCVRERAPSCPACTSATDCDDGNRCTQDSCVDAGMYVAASFSTCRNSQLPGCTQAPLCGDGILDPGEDCDLGDANGPSDVYLCQPRPPADGSPDASCDIPSSRFSWFEPDGKICFANTSGDPLCATQDPAGFFTLSRSQDGTTTVYSYGFAGPATMDFTDFTLSSTASGRTIRVHYTDSYDVATKTINFCPLSIEGCYQGTCTTQAVPTPAPGQDPCYHYRFQDRCNDTCQEPRCGDGVVDPGTPETCDDGNALDYDLCRNNCTRCGDGVPDPGEQCDDGNGVDGGDACKNDCTTAGVTDPCIVLPFPEYFCCRDHHLMPGSPEFNCCSEGKTPGTPEFGCCLDPTGPNCTPPQPACVTNADCDDKDPCTKDICAPLTADPESPMTCRHDADPEHCPPSEPRCGDGVMNQPTEECDFGPLNSDISNTGSPCTTTCRNKECGDGYVNTEAEECDDGNEIGTDGCSKCLKEICGNGRVDPGEVCDPGSPIQPLAVSKESAVISLDKYVEGTKTEFNKLGEPMSGYICKGDCTGYQAKCGDGIQDAGEECDPPGSTGKDGRVCTDLCTYTKLEEKCVGEKTARDSAYAKWDAGQDPEGTEFFAAAQVYCDCTGVQTLLCKHDDCPPCEGISDPALKACCERHGGLTVAASDECILDSNNPGPACQILFPTVEVGSFTFVNNGNICCNLVNAINSTLTDSGWLQCINGQLLPPGPGQPPLPPLPPLDICTSYLAAFGEMPPACLSLCQENPEAPECKDGPVVDPAGRALGIGTCTVEALNPEDIQDGEIVGIGRGGERVPLRVCLQMPAQTGLLSGKGMTFRFLQTDGRLSLLEGTTPDAETDQPLAGPKMLASITDFDGSGPLCRNAFAPLPKSMFGQTDQTVGYRYEAADLLGTALYEATCRSQPLYEASGGAGGEGCSCNLQATRPTRGVMTGNLVLLGLGLALLALRLIVGHRQGKRFFTKL